MNKNNSFAQLLRGVLLGSFFLLATATLVLFAYKIGLRLIDFFDIANKRPKIDYSSLKHDFKLDFESDKDANIFESFEAAHEIALFPGRPGQHALRVEFPSGREFPRLVFDVYGKDCLDWSDMAEFSFYVFNSIDRPAPFQIKIRSGGQYPKKEYETKVEAPANSLAKVKISRQELESVLDLSKISAISIFMHDPLTSYILYFDDFKVAKR